MTPTLAAAQPEAPPPEPPAPAQPEAALPAPQPAPQPAPAPVAYVVEPAPAPAEPAVAITLSPLHFIIPMAEVTAEIRVAPKVGLGLMGGFGAIRDDVTDDLIKVYEAGASLRYYALGTFRKGLQVGAEVQYVHAAVGDTASVMVSAEGLAIAPFVGYKWTHASGFTLDGQLGVAYFALRANDSVGSNDTSDRDIGPLLNLNVGWSF